MAIRSKDEILEQIQSRFGEDTSDETISFLEDVTDTFTDLETRASGDGEDWKAKYEENDKAWREKYRNRFMNTDEQKELEDEIKKEDKKDMSFESLFEEK